MSISKDEYKKMLKISDLQIFKYNIHESVVYIYEYVFLFLKNGYF